MSKKTDEMPEYKTQNNHEIITSKKFYGSLLSIAVISLISVYYKAIWGDLSGFASAVDRGPLIMQDFISFYYPMGRQMLQNPIPITGYFYSSFFAILLSAICFMPETSASLIWVVFQLLLIAGIIFITFRGFPHLRSSWFSLFVLLYLTSYPILNNFKWGQVSVLITMAAISSIYFLRDKKDLISGGVLAIAAAIKFYPAIFALVFFLKRANRTLMFFIIALLIFYIILPVATIGFSEWLEFEKITNSEITKAGWLSRDPNSQYIAHVGLRWFNIFFQKQGSELIKNVLIFTGLGMTFTTLIAGYLLGKMDEVYADNFLLISLFICIPFLLKTSWPHYFAYLPFSQAFLLFYCLNHLRHSFLAEGIALLPLTSIFLSSIFFFNLFRDWATYNLYGILFISNILLYLTICIILILKFNGSNSIFLPPRPTWIITLFKSE